MYKSLQCCFNPLKYSCICTKFFHLSIAGNSCSTFVQILFFFNCVSNWFCKNNFLIKILDRSSMFHLLLTPFFYVSSNIFYQKMIALIHQQELAPYCYKRNHITMLYIPFTIFTNLNVLKYSIYETMTYGKFLRLTELQEFLEGALKEYRCFRELLRVSENHLEVLQNL